MCFAPVIIQGGNFGCPIPKILSSRVPICIFGKRPSRVCSYILGSRIKLYTEVLILFTILTVQLPCSREFRRSSKISELI
jgi:hypothetical protein